ncbi:MAG: acyl-CoA reductase [Candidatus Heimdallarchaeaceae archaeon]|jgi:hypothetical protein
MSKLLKGYYLPPSFEDIEEELEFEERELSDTTLLVPKYFGPEIAEKIMSGLRINHDIISKMEVEDIVETYDKVGKKWGEWEDYTKKKIALKYLPELIGYTPEVIDYFQFKTIYQINHKSSKDLVNYLFPMEVFIKFTQIPDTKTWIRAFASILDLIRLRRIMKNELKELKIITYITPKNVPGIIESLGIFLANIVKSTIMVKAPMVQPLFACLYAESIAEESPDLGESIAVVPWKGGNKDLERVIYSHSDVLSVVGSNRTIKIIRKDVDKLNREGYDIKGCYHGRKCGLDVVSIEFLMDEDTARKVATLMALDGVGYEGFMCASPVLGFFVEAGGRINGIQFAKLLAEASLEVSKLIPQSDYFQLNRCFRLAEMMLESIPDRQIFHGQNDEYTVIYEPKFELNPIGQNRLHRVFEIPELDFLIRKIRSRRKYLQTIGIAVPNERLFGQKIAEKLGKAGLSSLRVVGSACIARLGETWDGNYPIYEFYIPDFVHWSSINAADVTEEISRLYENYKELQVKGVFG